ncbi:hypothetical protein Shyhy01_75430 [Streptomyces hygroscopicus subsp. hygroscopicus]|nr:hypothetical protein Shyhy01_75430 [Streptomyces hygroscopicus subsp. hygroscopicus]
MAAFAEAAANPPHLFDLAPAEGREAVGEVQRGDIAKPAVDEEWSSVSGGPTGSVRARIVKPAGAEGALPVVLYVHGAGQVFGNAHTHGRLVWDVAANAAFRTTTWPCAPGPPRSPPPTPGPAARTRRSVRCGPAGPG